MSWQDNDSAKLRQNAKEPLTDKDSILDTDTNESTELSPDQVRERDYADKVCTLIGLYFVLGVINNSGYTMINTAAQGLSRKFNKANLMGTIQLSLSIFSALLRVFNSQYLLRIKHFNKIATVVLIWVVGYALFYLSFQIDDNDVGFLIMILATLLIGNFASVANVTAVGFMKTFPARVVTGFSSGTGFAGIVGSGVVVLTKAVKLQFEYVCLAFIPISIMYLVIFRTIQAQKIHKPGEADNTLQDSAGNQNMTWDNIKASFRHVSSPIINLSLVYYFEYACLASFIDRANPFSESADVPFVEKYAVPCLNLTYQVGVFISRSSLPVVKIERITLITIGQFIVYLIFFSVAIWKWLNVYQQIPIMFVCGLFGGGSFVNCYYMLMKNDTIDKSVREVAIGVMGILNEVGVISASLFALFISNFVLTNK